MAEISLVREANEFVPEYMPILIRIDRSDGIDDAERIRWLGSAFVVGVQMLFTAKHVALQLLAEDPDLAGGTPSRIQYAIVQVLKGSQQLIMWNIHSIGMIDNCDVALITLAAAHDGAKKYLRWSGLPLTFIPPRIGDRIAGKAKVRPSPVRMANAWYSANAEIQIRGAQLLHKSQPVGDIHAHTYYYAKAYRREWVIHN